MASRWQRDFLFECHRRVDGGQSETAWFPLEIDTPTSLFKTRMESFLPSFDVSADGQRFLVVSSSPQKLPSPIKIVINWEAGLKAQ